MIRCHCIDATGKPVTFPQRYWVKVETDYTVTWMFWDPINQNIGVELKEIPKNEEMLPFEGFRIDRFVFHHKDLEAIIKMFKACNEAANLDVEQFFKERELVTTE